MSDENNLHEIGEPRAIRKLCEHGVDGIERTDGHGSGRIRAALPALVVPSQNGSIEVKGRRVLLGEELGCDHDGSSPRISRRLHRFVYRSEVGPRIALNTVENNNGAGYLRLRLAPITRYVNRQQSGSCGSCHTQSAVRNFIHSWTL